MQRGHRPRSGPPGVPEPLQGVLQRGREGWKGTDGGVKVPAYTAARANTWFAAVIAARSSPWRRPSVATTVPESTISVLRLAPLAVDLVGDVTEVRDHRSQTCRR